MSEYDNKIRGRSKYNRKIKEKSKLKHGCKNKVISYYTPNSSEIKNILYGNSSKLVDYPPNNEFPLFDSPPCSREPKKKRSRQGFNSGKPKVCTMCYPKVTFRCYRTSLLRHNMNKVNKVKTSYEFEDTEFSDKIEYMVDGYETS